MATVQIKNDKLVVNLSLFEKISSLRNSFSIDLANVRGATDDPNYIKSGLGFRAPGTGIPGVVAEGTFYKNGLKKLSLWRRGQEILVVELENSKFDRLIIGCKDAQELARSINAALSDC